MPSANRQKVVVANWKMYKTIEETVEFIKKLAEAIKDTTLSVYIAVPFTAINLAVEEAKDSKIVIGAQNMNDANEGAFTGEIAGQMLKDAGAKFVLLGHSERRNIFHETNAFINRKVKRALLDGLQPILCIGENLEEREAEKTHEVLKKQLSESLEGIEADQMDNILIAYEPVWAIGTGKTATPEMAEETHHYIRELIKESYDKTADKIVILYGGSVKPDNAKSLMEQPDIDGLLVGGASLSLDSFIKIVHDSGSELKQ